MNMFLLPMFRVGARGPREWMYDRKGKWFCTELITCALQCMGAPPFEHVRPCDSSPNMLYRLASGFAGGCQPTCRPPGARG